MFNYVYAIMENESSMSAQLNIAKSCVSLPVEVAGSGPLLLSMSLFMSALLGRKLLNLIVHFIE
jgi:hypothetical protein